ncbi:MAG: NAD(P)/FAD-dependent oxidoreductase [Pseudomonadales bacterium]
MEDYRDLSFWHASLDERITPRDRLQGEVQADVVIVGAGYAGLWTAYYLKILDPALEIAIVEAQFAGFGAAGRNGGWCSLNLSQFESLAQQPETRSQAAEILPFLFDMVDEVGRVTQAENIDCHFHKGGVVHVAISEKQRTRALRTHELFERLGHGEAQSWLEPDDMDRHVRVVGSLGGIRSPHCAVVQPARLVRGLAAVVEAKGVRIYESSPALRIRQGRVDTAAGHVRARSVIIATEGYSGGLAETARLLLPIHAFMIVTEPLPESVFAEIGLDDRPAFADGRLLVTYGQRTLDNRLAFGYGARTHLNGKPRDRFDSGDPLFKTLERILHQLFPVVSDARIEQTWGGPMGATRSLRTFVRHDPESGVGWIGGFLGNGVAATNLGGRAMADLVLGRDSDLSRLSLLVEKGVDPLANQQRWEPAPIPWLGTGMRFRRMYRADKKDVG